MNPAARSSRCQLRAARPVSFFVRGPKRAPEIYHPRPWLVTVRTTPFQSNCFILHTEEHKALLVDPGSDWPIVAAELDRLGAVPSLILGTHGHFDHIGNADHFQRTYGCSCFVHPADEWLYRRLSSVGPFTGIRDCRNIGTVSALIDGAELEWESRKLLVLHTPGHTPGGCCFSMSFGGESLLFTGDTLFRGAIGRTDIERSSHEQLVASVRSRLFPLPEDTQVFPGHGRPSSIGAEREANPLC